MSGFSRSALITQETPTLKPAIRWSATARFQSLSGVYGSDETITSAFSAEYEFSPVAQLTLDANGLIWRLNWAAAGLLGADKSRVLRLPFTAFVKKSHFRVFLDQLHASINSRKTLRTRIELARFTRAAFPVELHTAAGVDLLTGETMCWVVMVEALPDRTNEQSVFENDHAFSQLCELSHDAVIVEIDGKIASANRGARKLFGAKSRDQLLGRSFLDFVHPDNHELVRHRRQQLARGQRELPLVIKKFLRLDKSIVAVRVMSSFMIFQGQPAVLILAHDVSKERKLEELLEEAERFFGELLANNSIAAAIVCSDDGRFLKINSVFCTLIGLGENEICGRTMAEIPVRLIDTNKRDLFQIRDGGAPIQNAEVRIERRDGKLIDVLLSAKATSFDRKSCLLLTLQDLTDVRRLEKEVIDMAEQEKRRFSRDLHDGHCQDLTALVFFAENLATSLEEIDLDSANRVRSLGEMIQRSAENVHALAAGLSSQKTGPSGLDDALTDLAFRKQQQFRIVCTTTIAERGRISDNALVEHLYRIAQEAVSNAARHGRPENIEIQLSFEGRKGVLRVVDNGIGFAAKDKPIGLGLRTMGYRAGVIKGALHVDSELGKGTVVTCSFPLP